MTTKTRLTYNKRLILEALTENIDCQPPHSASHIFYILETAFNLKWSGIYEGMKTLTKSGEHLEAWLKKA
jgi:hypothetical protein